MPRSGYGMQVVVVGASTSGLYTAILLARRGFEVTLLERSGELDPANRTLIVTSRMHDYLGQLGNRSVVNKIDQFELYADGRMGTVELGEPDLIIERSILIRDLAKEAEALGVHVRLGVGVASLNSVGGALELTTRSSDGERPLVANVVVGADGLNSTIARSTGWGRQPSVPLVQAIVRVPDDCSPSTSRVWFRPEDSPYFYWLIPESDTHGALGLIGERGRPVKKLLDRFLQDKGFDPVEYQAAQIPCYAGWRAPHRRFNGGDVYLVGDAAGHVKISTVGGIVTGFRGAHAVAESVATDARSREMRALRRELDLHLVLRRALHRFSVNDYLRLLDLMNEGVHRSLHEATRDDTVELFLRLARSQPRLLLLAARGLLGSKDFRQTALRSVA